MDCSKLVVDDTSQRVVALSEMLEELECSVTSLPNGKNALYAWGENSYHFVVADLKLSQVNGWTVLQKAESVEPERMIFLLTGSYDSPLFLNSYPKDADHDIISPCCKEDVSMSLKPMLQGCARCRTSGRDLAKQWISGSNLRLNDFCKSTVDTPYRIEGDRPISWCIRTARKPWVGEMMVPLHGANSNHE
jgi:CheY-like chemotaxis protein